MIFLKFIAHRGLRTDKIKENTIAAFQNAINSVRMDGFEFDIRETKDKKFVVNHNAFIKHDLIKTKTAKELKRKYQLPLLEEVLKLQTDKIMLIEIKDAVISYKAFLKIVKRYKNKNVYIMSFHNKVIHKLKEYEVPAKIGVLNYVFNSEEDYSYDFIGLLSNLTTPKIKDYFKKKQIEIFVYGVLNEEKDLIYKDAYYIVNKEPIKVI